MHGWLCADRAESICSRLLSLPPSCRSSGQTLFVMSGVFHWQLESRCESDGEGFRKLNINRLRDQARFPLPTWV